MYGATAPATAVTARITRPDPVGRLLAAYPTATLELLTTRALLSRIDSKFVMPASRLPEILEALGRDYAVLRVDSGPLALYESLYFDTPDLQCFHDHRRGRRLRHKVRIRHYPDRRLTFLEVKSKRNSEQTDKLRLQLAYGVETLGAAELGFLRGHVGDLADQLRPTLPIVYRRIGLLSLISEERVTLDLGLSTSGEPGDVVARALGHLAVIEVKQDRYCLRTPIMRALRAASVRETSVSKYNTALALVHPELRRNQISAALRTLERI
jgi:hypothetical protein